MDKKTKAAMLIRVPKPKTKTPPVEEREKMTDREKIALLHKMISERTIFKNQNVNCKN